jgi:hypothetical protein
MKFLKYFLSYALLKMDRFLLNSNNRRESENKEETSSTGGKSVKKRKNRKQDNYFDFGFTSTEGDGEERPQYVLCMKLLPSECMLLSKLKRHLKTTHPGVVSKSYDYFSRKLKELNQQKGSFYKQASIPSNALIASYKAAHRIAKYNKPHIIAEELILPAAVDMVNIMIGEFAGKLLSKVPLSNNTISYRMQHIVRLKGLGQVRNALFHVKHCHLG